MVDTSFKPSSLNSEIVRLFVLTSILTLLCPRPQLSASKEISVASLHASSKRDVEWTIISDDTERTESRNLEGSIVGLLGTQAIPSNSLAIVGYRSTAVDEFSIITLADLSVGDQFFFSEASVDGATIDHAGDTWRVTIDANVSAGTVITFTDAGSTWSVTGATVSQLGFASSGGSPYADTSPSASLSTSDHILLFTSTDNAASIGNSTNHFFLDVNEGVTPTGLSNGSGLVSRGSLGASSTFGQLSAYTGPTTGSAAELYTEISDISNWSFVADVAGGTNQIGTSATVGSTTAPEINIKQSTNDIASGGTYPFGNVQIGDSKDVIFTVENTGDAPLDVVSITPTGMGYSISSGISVDPIPSGGSATFIVRFQPTATNQTSGSATITSDDADEGSYVINFTSGVTLATLSFKVFLEGALTGTMMSTTLNTALPVNPTSVYSGVVSETSTGIPVTAVDWVEVELRNSATGPKIGTNRAGLLHSDGSITDKDGNAFNMSQVDGSDYYIVIHHRNHLSVMSSSAVSPSAGIYSFDFTVAQANNYGNGSDGAVQVGSVYGMIAGDQNSDGQVNATDLTNWRMQNGGSFSYAGSTADFNLDGQVNAVDRNDYQQPNSGKTSQVPTN